MLAARAAVWLADRQPVLRLIVSSCRPGPGHNGQGTQWAENRPPDWKQISLLSGVSETDLEALPEPLSTALTQRWQADLAVAQQLSAPSARVLRIPVTAWCGSEDLVSFDEMAGWSSVSTGPFDLKSWPGGHNYLFQRPSPVKESLRKMIIAHFGSGGTRIAEI